MKWLKSFGIYTLLAQSVFDKLKPRWRTRITGRIGSTFGALHVHDNARLLCSNYFQDVDTGSRTCCSILAFRAGGQTQHGIADTDVYPAPFWLLSGDHHSQTHSVYCLHPNSVTVEYSLLDCDALSRGHVTWVLLWDNVTCPRISRDRKIGVSPTLALGMCQPFEKLFF